MNPQLFQKAFKNLLLQNLCVALQEAYQILPFFKNSLL